ncbi:hypothetical protein D3C85_1339170 [compost metagenome]
MLRASDNLLRSYRIYIRIVEQSKLELQCKHPPDRKIKRLRIKLALMNGIHQMLAEHLTGHFHINACTKCLNRRVKSIFSHIMSTG